MTYDPPPSPKLKILHVIPGLSNASGPTHALYHLVHQIAELGHEVTVCYISGRGTEPDMKFDDRIQLLGFPARYLKKWGYSPALRLFLQKKAGQFDLIHLHSLWLYPNIAVHRAACKYKVPYIIRPAGSLEPWALGFSAWKKRLYFALIEKKIINRAAAIHAVSGQEAENIKTLGLKPPIVVISNGIDVQSFQIAEVKKDLRRRLNLPEDKFILLFLSRIHPKKNLELLGKIVKKLQQKYEDILLVIAGPNQHEYARQIKTYYKDLGIDQCTVFIGEVRGLEKVQTYHAADLFVLPSHSENFGIVVLEALASGLPVAVSRYMPWENAEEAGAGYCLELNEGLFVEKISTFYEDKALQTTSAESAIKFAQQFDWGKIALRIIEMYKGVTQHKIKK